MAERKIGSRTYRCEKMPATASVRNLVRLTKIIGPGMSRLSGLLAVEKEASAPALAAISEILAASTADELTQFIVDMAELAQVKENSGSYESVIFDLHCNDLLEGFQVVAFVLQTNYASFFGGKLGNVLKANSPAA